MQSTRWRLAADSTLTNDHHHKHHYRSHDDAGTGTTSVKDRQRNPGRKVVVAPPGSLAEPSRPAYTPMRPTHHRPGFLEELLQRPHKVQCWGCHSFAWLPRKGPESPSDWTCGVCQTHQRRDKHGDLIPVPEMYESGLNKETTELLDHAVRRRGLGRRSVNNTDQDKDDDSRSVFCRTCRTHHRLTYQMMSDYLPDEDDPDYEMLLNNMEHRRKTLEQRYPPVCDSCLPKVEQVLANQRLNLRTNLFNVALRKSKVDHIRSIRKYPRLSWIFAAFFWTCGNTILFVLHYYGAGLPDVLPSFGSANALKQPTSLARDLNQLVKDNWHPNLGMIALVTAFTALVAMDFTWNPLQFSLDKSHGQLRTRRTLRLVQIGSIPLRTVQCWSLHSLCSSPPNTYLSACLFVLQFGFCCALFNGRYIRDPVTISLGSSRSTATRTVHGQEEDAGSCSDSEQRRDKMPRASPDPFRRTVRHRRKDDTSSSERAQSKLAHQSSADSIDGFGESRFSSSTSHPWNSRSSSPDHDNINWSPRKPRQAGAGQLPPQFGMYRDPGNPMQQNHGSNGSSHQDQERTVFSHGGLQSLNSSNKFHSRAYEPSPLAQPSMVMEAAQQGASLGDMFGFPSARFQPPENHFAHRSAASAPHDAWSYRRKDESHTRASRPRSLLDDMDINDTHDMDDDDEEDEEDEDDADGSDGDIRSARRTLPKKTKHKRGGPTSEVDDIFGSLGFSSSSVISTNGHVNPRSKRGLDTFGQQRFFPPDANTGLEENFWGAVKIEDDKLPNIPRTREGRNMAMKKRLAIRWLAIGVVSRAVIHYVTVPLVTLSATILFIAVLLHAIGFWIVDERQSWKLLGNRSGQRELAKFKPALMDKVFSHVLFLCCVGRLCLMLIVGFEYEDQVAEMFSSWAMQDLSWSATASALDGMMVVSLLGLILAGSGHSSAAPS